MLSRLPGLHHSVPPQRSKPEGGIDERSTSESYSGVIHLATIQKVLIKHEITPSDLVPARSEPGALGWLWAGHGCVFEVARKSEAAVGGNKGVP